MTLITNIIKDFKTPPVAVKSGSVKPAKVTRVQSRDQVKKTVSDNRKRPRQAA